MNQGDSLAFGLVFLLGGTGAVLATMGQRFKLAFLAVSVLFLGSQAIPLTGMDVRVPWGNFTELSAVGGGLLFVVALVRTARLIMGGEDRVPR
jgi:hypothetical protein